MTDNRNHLIGVLDSNNIGTTLTLATYVYDALDRRFEKDFWTQASGLTTVTRSAFDGTDAWADLDGSGNMVDRYFRGDQQGQLEVQILATGVNRTLADHLVSIRQVTNSSGTVVDTLTYDGYGVVMSESSPSNGSVYKWADYRYYSEAGLYLPDGIERTYKPDSGGWLQQDPTLFNASDANTERYVGNNPTNSIDPTGMGALSPAVKIVKVLRRGAYGRIARRISESALLRGLLEAHHKIPQSIWNGGGSRQMAGAVGIPEG